MGASKARAYQFYRVQNTYNLNSHFDKQHSRAPQEQRPTHVAGRCFMLPATLANANTAMHKFVRTYIFAAFGLDETEALGWIEPLAVSRRPRLAHSFRHGSSTRRVRILPVLSCLTTGTWVTSLPRIRAHFPSKVPTQTVRWGWPVCWGPRR